MDPFTQMLLERTKASRSKLEAKISNTPQPLPRKRRSPLKDNITLTEIALQKINDEADDSPGKRQCVQFADEKVKRDMKENKSANRQSASRRSSQETNKSPKIILPKATPLDEVDGNISKQRTNRLAKLAAHINSWEDDLKDSSTLPRAKPIIEPVSKKVTPISESSPSSSSSRSTSSSPSQSPSPPVNRRSSMKKSPYSVNPKLNRMSKSPSPLTRRSLKPKSPPVESSELNNRLSRSPVKTEEFKENARSPLIPPIAKPRRRSSSFSVSSTSQPARQSLNRKQSFSAEKRTTKTMVWDQAVVATLEAQGFVQSPSRSKLEYDFHSAARKKILDSESSEESESDSSMEDDSQSSEPVSPKQPIKSPMKSPSKTVEPGRISVRQLAEKFTTPTTKAPKRDPAELPLSARVALFEKEAQTQKANLQKKPSLTNTTPAKTFPKVNPQQTKTQAKVQPVESTTKQSPSKAVGHHTFELHRKLFEHGRDWKENEISQKIKVDREKDMEVVLNRWNYNNKKAAEEAAYSVTSQRVAKTQQPSTIQKTQKPVFSPAVKKEIPVPPPLPAAPITTFETPEWEHLDSDTDQFEGSSSETDSDIDYQKHDPQLDSEEELNKALACVDEICTDEDEETDLDSSIVKEAFQKIENVTPKKASSSDYTFKVPAPAPSLKKHEDVQPDEEHSLLHTISFYRRQKEMNRYTVLKSIVRNEVTSPEGSKSSTDEDDSQSSVDLQQSIQQKIKQLQEDVSAQQAVMRQASQALVLCRNNELFQGSLEQIEGERLLLVSAQKRQACVSEIERLKTDGAFGTLSSGNKVSRGSLSMGDMKLVLKREFLEQTANGKSGEFVHFFICLIKHRGQVIASQMMGTTDEISAGALHFPNLINIRDLERDFNILIEVYGLQTKRESIIRDQKTLFHKKDKSKLTLTPKKRQSKKDLRMISPKVQSPGGPNVICTSSFALIGYTTLNIKNLNKKSWNLEKVPYVSPLEGSLVMKVRCFSEFNNEEQGFLSMFDDVGGFGAWHRRWFVLSDRVLSYWKYPDDVKQKAPIGQINLRECITPDVGLVARDICARPNTFMLLIVRPPSKENTDSLIVHNFKSYATVKVLLSADTKEERICWCRYLNKTLENLRTWDPDALRPMPENFDLKNI